MRWTTYATQPASIFPNGYPTLPCEVPAKRELSLENKRRVILSSTGTKLIAAKRREMQDAIQVSRTIINRVIEVISLLQRINGLLHFVLGHSSQRGFGPDPERFDVARTLVQLPRYIAIDFCVLFFRDGLRTIVRLQR